VSLTQEAFMKYISLPLFLLLGCVASSADKAPTYVEKAAQFKVAVLIYDNMEILDFAGPKEVFSATNDVAAYYTKPRPFEVYTVTPKALTITTIDGTTITADFSLSNAPTPDILVVPGAPLAGIAALNEDAAALTWIKSQKTKVTMSVCSGALILAKAGLLANQDATTHHMAMEPLKALSPTTKILADHRYVDTGAILTTGGVSAGIDGTLHLVDRLLGREAATGVAKYVMEYPWDPEGVIITPVTM
jgi:transcriptional regulator GlxA family with amidase domain